MAGPSPRQSVVAGITLETVPLEKALELLGMSQEELEAVMAASETWPFPGHLDGWKLSHNAIRRDMDAFMKAIDKTKELVESGQQLQAWQIEALQLVARDLHHTIHFHHDHEERIFFPWIESRVKLPPKMSSDHRTLMSLLDRVRATCEGLKATDGSSALAQLTVTFCQLRSLMRQHLEEEEILGLPLMRKHFTAAEMAVPEKQIVAELKPADVAWFLRPMKDVAEKRRTMTQLGIPGFVQRLVMVPAIRRDERTIMRAYGELAKGEPQQPQAKRMVWRPFCGV